MAQRVSLLRKIKSNGRTFMARPLSALPLLVAQQLRPQQLQLLQQTEEMVLAAIPAGCHRSLARLIVSFIDGLQMHVRVIAAVDGMNNVACGACEACRCGQEASCRYAGTQGVVHACQDLLSPHSWLRLQLELSLVLADAGRSLAASDSSSVSALEALCAATGGVYHSVRDKEKAQWAASTLSRQWTQRTRDRKAHVAVRQQQVRKYRDDSRVNVHIETVFQTGDLDCVDCGGYALRGSINARKRKAVSYAEFFGDRDGS